MRIGTLPFSKRTAAILATEALLVVMATGVFAQTNLPPASLRAKETFETTRSQFQTNATNINTGVAFARACFDWAEVARNNREREQIAREGIAVARKLAAQEPKLAAAHYYLGMNLAQLARTKSLGALKIIGEMEDEFTISRSLDERFDFAGADRNLGLLYLEAPSFLMGDKKKARQHLQSAVTLAPDYPENRLNLMEAYLSWNEKKLARAEADALEKLWPEGTKKFTGVEWETSWADWEKRFQKMKSRLGPREK